VVVEAYGNDKGLLGGVKVQNVKSKEVTDVPVSGLFFAIGHEPATKFLDGQLDLDEAGYIVTAPDSTATSVVGVYAAGDVQDAKWRQAITAAGSGRRAGSCRGANHSVWALSIGLKQRCCPCRASGVLLPGRACRGSSC
jgi:thioredoxin reductase